MKDARVLLEVVPPRSEDIMGCYKRLPKVLEQYGGDIDAINVPDVRDGEELNRPFTRLSQMDFAYWMRDVFPKQQILYRVVVHEPEGLQEAWMKQAVDAGVESVILVGGDSTGKQYTGVNLSEAAEIARRQRLTYGGVLIPTRRCANPQRPASEDEVDRVRRKLDGGYSAFFTQVLYEGESTKSLLADLMKAGVVVPRIYLSFSPVTDRGGIKFLRRLGVYIPDEVERALIDEAMDARDESSRMALDIWDGIVGFCMENGIPEGVLGVNVEYVDLKNLKPAVELAQEFSRRLARKKIGDAPCRLGVRA